MSQTAPAPPTVDKPVLSQSPVDIRPQDTGPSALPPLRFHHPTRLAPRLHFDDPRRHRPDTVGSGCVRDDQGTVKAEPLPGQECLLSVGTDTYELADVHWHTPSEHTVGGVAFPMEQHMKYR